MLWRDLDLPGGAVNSPWGYSAVYLRLLALCLFGIENGAV